MSEPKETQEGLFVMRWRNLIPIAVLMIGGTNTASIFYQEQMHDREKIKYNAERLDRKIKNERERNGFLRKIDFLELKLQECKEK